MLFTPAFYQHYGTEIGNAGVGLSYRLKGGNANLSRFLRSVSGQFGPTVQVQPGSDDLAAAANASYGSWLGMPWANAMRSPSPVDPVPGSIARHQKRLSSVPNQQCSSKVGCA
jgi:hypothetical protein